MRQESFKSPDDLIQGIRSILSKNRCSFSVEEQALLEDCITKLEETKTKPPSDPQIKLDKIQVLTILMRVFAAAKHLFDLFNN
ncbi:hypothetical protein D3C72_2228990 [compost metagenome]